MAANSQKDRFIKGNHSCTHHKTSWIHRQPPPGSNFSARVKGHSQARFCEACASSGELNHLEIADPENCWPKEFPHRFKHDNMFFKKNFATQLCYETFNRAAWFVSHECHRWVPCCVHKAMCRWPCQRIVVGPMQGDANYWHIQPKTMIETKKVRCSIKSKG